MNVCQFCGKNPGLFHTEHTECRRRHDMAVNNLRRLIFDAVVDGRDLQITRQQGEHLSRSNYLGQPEHDRLVAEAWMTALDHFMVRKQMANNQLTRLLDAADLLAIDRNLLQQFGVKDKLLKYDAELKREEAEHEKVLTIARTREAVLASLRRGEMPTYPYSVPALPFVLTSKERLIWLFDNVSYCEEKVQRRNVRDSQSFGRHGMYMGHSVSKRVEWSEIVKVGVGSVAFSSKYIYFAGTEKSFRVAFNKLVTIKPYTDALEVVKEAANPKRQIFANMDGSYAYELSRLIVSLI